MLTTAKSKPVIKAKNNINIIIFNAKVNTYSNTL